MKKPKPTNKAISDSINGLLENGINVNVNIKTESLFRLSLFAVITTIVIGAVSYTFNKIKR